MPSPVASRPIRPAARPPARGRRGRRSGAEAERTRARIVRAAERLFARKGYGAVSLRDLARAAGVHMFTIQHHFGSKQGLYQAILTRWDRDVEALVSGLLAPPGPVDRTVARVVATLFDFFVANRPRVAVNARAALGDGLGRVTLGDRSWMRFMRANMNALQLATGGFDVGLLLISLEGLLHNHVLAAPHYRELYGRDVTDPAVAARVKSHLTRLLLALLANSAIAPAATRRRRH